MGRCGRRTYGYSLWEFEVYGNIPVGPPAPTGLTATAGNMQVALSWNASSGATNYNVKSSTTNGGPYLTIASPTTTGYTNIGLVNETAYYYVVSATDGGLESANSFQAIAKPTEATTNLALHKVVTVSSVENVGTPGTNAVDGDYTTRWSSASSDPQWIYVDLQAIYNITRVKLTWETAYATSFQIQVSSDAVNWTNIYTTTTGTGGTNDLTGLSGTGRFVRMYGTVRATTYGYSLWEFEVYGDVPLGPPTPTGLTATAGNTQVALSWNTSSGATSYNVKSSTTNGGPYLTIASPTTTGYTNTGLVNETAYYYEVSATDGSNESANSIQAIATPTAATTNLALHKVVTVSSVENVGTPGTNAVDGDYTTRWSSTNSDPQWIYVDLQAIYNITRVKLTWETAYATSFQIQVSSDAVNWTNIYTTTTGTGGTNDLTGLSGTGRFVRMYGTVRATTYGYSLWEFEVYGYIPAPANQPPVLSAISNQTIMAGRTLLITNSATDPDIPAQTLTFSLLTAPTNAAINSSSGLFTWRPTIAQSPSTQTVAVVVADNGAPIMSATQSFTATVIQPVVPTLNAVSITSGQFGFLINGSTGPDYTILASTNLTSWNPVFLGNSLAVPYFWVDTNSSSYPIRFYRTVLGP